MLSDRWLVFSFASVALIGCGPSINVPEAEGGGTMGAEDGTSAASLTSGTVPTTGADTDAADGDTTAGDPPGPPPLPPPPQNCGEGTVVDPWLHIDGTDLDERSKLEGVRVVDGDLVIHRAPDADLSFLECLIEVTGDLVLFDNDALVDVSGLAFIERIGGDIVIADNDALVDFDALTLVTNIESSQPPGQAEVFHSLIILGNASLETIHGLWNLQTIFGDFHVRDNPNLVDIAGLVGIVAVGGSLAVNHNESLCSSQVVALGDGITTPDEPPDGWTTIANNEGC